MITETGKFIKKYGRISIIPVRLLFLLLILLAAGTGFSAENSFTECNRAILSGDLEKAKSIIDSWGNSKDNDPQYYICQFNYYVNLARSSGISIKSTPQNKDSMKMVDDNGNTAAYLGEETVYDVKTAQKGIDYIKKGIARFPDHYEMRFGLLYCYKELGQYGNYLTELDSAMSYYYKLDGKPMYWNDNKKIEDPSVFFIETVQGNFYELSQNESVMEKKDFLHKYCDLMIKHFPKSKYGYSNKGVLYYLSHNEDEALSYFLKAHALDKEDELIMLNIGIFYQNSGDRKNAEKYFNMVIKSGKEAQYVNSAKERLEQLK